MCSRWGRLALVWGLVAILAACGGGGSETGAPPAPAAGPPVIGAAGGTASEASGARVIVPAGAFETDTTIRVAMESTGAPALPPGLAAGDRHSSDPVLSGDGRYVLFRTNAPNLTGDPAATVRPYLVRRDRQTRTIVVASRRVDGSNVWVGGFGHALSSDGSVLAFVADMVDLVGPGTLGEYQVFAAPSP